MPSSLSSHQEDASPLLASVLKHQNQNTSWEDKLKPQKNSYHWNPNTSSKSMLTTKIQILKFTEYQSSSMTNTLNKNLNKKTWGSSSITSSWWYTGTLQLVRNFISFLIICLCGKKISNNNSHLNEIGMIEIKKERVNWGNI